MSVQLPEWMAGEYAVIRSGPTTAMVRGDFVDSFHKHRLVDCARAPLLSLPAPDDDAQSPDDGLTGGRGGVRIVTAGSLGEAVVRPYRRGGAVEAFNRRRYFLGDRAFSELVSTHRLRRRGAPVPEALAAIQSAMRPGYEACFVTRRIPRARTAAAALAGSNQAYRARILESMGRAIRLFHEAGGVHADLNAHNILVPDDGEGAAFVIDLDRAAVLDGPVSDRRARANLRRLRRSLTRLDLRDALDDWDRLESGYSAPLDPPPAA